jgi:PhnB protein
VDHRPARYRNAVVPHIYVEGAAEAIAFYRQAFGAEELFRVTGGDGRMIHGEFAVCGAVVMIGDPGDARLYGEPRRLGACTAGLHIFTNDNETLMQRATAAGCETVQPLTPMFYGATSGSVRDPYGHVWVLLTWTEDLTPAEIEQRAADL